MKTKTRRWLFALSAAIVIAMLALLFSTWLLNEPLDGASMVIDGERIVLHGFDTPHAALLIVGGAALVILALLAALLVVVLAVFAAALGIALAFLASTATVLVSVSPLLLIGWLVWRALRKPASSLPPAASLTAAS